MVKKGTVNFNALQHLTEDIDDQFTHFDKIRTTGNRKDVQRERSTQFMKKRNINKRRCA